MPNNPHSDEPSLQTLVDEFVADKAAVERRYRLTHSTTRRERMERLLRDWEARVAEVPFDRLGSAGKIDYTLLRNHFERCQASIRRSEVEALRMVDLVPFGPTIVALDGARTAMEPLDAAQTARTLDTLAKEIAATPDLDEDAPANAWQAELRDAMNRWAAFYTGYDPALDWWIREPLARVVDALRTRTESKETPEESIPGRALGRAALLEDLALEMIPYSPERLIEIGEREYAWCLEKMLLASRELGFGEDWRAALESVKETCLPPGEQPAMVRGLALEAIDFVDDLVTIPDLAKETWTMEMMSREDQRVNPFFLGGETIVVSYPTDAMTPEEKRMSMRGNNPNFSRATVQHELIPGHHLQMFMAERHRPYRRLFSTPFWIEGWTLYWELLLWDLGFPRTPEERIGMLFWRMHRCVRVTFSLRFHLGEMTTAECVDMLVERVGHERLNAEGEVRRSFNGLYPPLYQAAYLIGGLQFQAISREMRDKGWTFKEVHDAMLRENEMPPALMRLALLGESPDPNDPPIWRFDY